MDFVSGAFMLVGIVAAFLRWRWPSRGMILLWFCSTVVMAWGVTENPPSSQRGTILLPAVASWLPGASRLSGRDWPLTRHS